MKTILKSILLPAGLALMTVSCSENSWNDHLDGFEKGPQFTDVQTIDYTLTASDYTRIAKNYRNVAKAQAAGLEDELAAVGTLGYLNQQITPAEYVPALFKDSLFAYYGLTEGSAINLTYRVADNLPAQMIRLNAASQYRLNSDDYKTVYGSDTDYADAFSPSHSAADNLPALLLTKFPDAADGDYAVVQYNNSDVDPVFGSAPSTPDEPAFAESDVLGAVALDQEITVNGTVTAICKQGFILTDKGGSILVYFGKSYDNSYEIGQQLAVTGKVSAYNFGFQLDNGKGNVTSIKEMGKASSVKYPTPKIVTGADMDAAIAAKTEATAVYVQMTGTLTKSWYEKGGYYNYNVAVDGASSSTGSLYQLPDAIAETLEDGAVYTFTGYFTSVSGGKYYNVLVTDVKAGAAKNRRRGPSHVATIASVNTYAVYYFNGTKWSQPSDVTVLQPSDYVEMGSTYGNLELDQAERYIPLYMNRKFPYGTDDAVKYVVYRCFTGGSTVLRCEQYTFTGGKWENSVSNGGVITETQQFVYKPEGWKMDPSIVLTLPAGKNQPASTLFFQTCVDWVKANVPDGASFISSYGTNEYYCGTSAFQGNIDLRPSAAVTQNPTAYAGMSDEQIVALEKKRFEDEVCPGALAMLYPKINAVPGVEVTVTIHFSIYDGSTKEHTIIYNVTGKAQFEFVSCTWNVLYTE